jgi:hypothetical protein
MLFNSKRYFIVTVRHKLIIHEPIVLSETRTLQIHRNVIFIVPITVPNWKIFYTGSSGKDATNLKHFLNQVEYEAETEKIH